MVDSEIKILEEKKQILVVGSVTYKDIALDDEDDEADCFVCKKIESIDIMAIRIAHILNFTDFNTL